MNTKQIIEITQCLETIKNAQFYQVNWALIGFQTDAENFLREQVIKTSPLNYNHAVLTKELNEAIKPVLEKYAKIYEKELYKIINH